MSVLVSRRYRKTKLVVGALLALSAGWVQESPSHGADEQGVVETSYEAHLMRGKMALERGDWNLARSEGLAATQINMDLPDAYLVIALAFLNEGQLDTGFTFLDLAEERADPAPGAFASQGKISEVRSQYSSNRDFDSHMRMAEEAEQAFLVGKAAREYRMAWEAWPQQVNVGVKAATLFLSLQDPETAGRILVRVLAEKKPVGDLKEAKLVYDAHLGEFKACYQKKMGEAAGLIGRDPHQVESLLLSAVAVFPAGAEAWIGLAWKARADGREDVAVKYFLELAKTGKDIRDPLNGRWGSLGQIESYLSVDAIESIAASQTHAGEAWFQSVVLDIWGETIRAQANQILLQRAGAIRAEEKRKEEIRLKEEAEKRRVEEERRRAIEEAARKEAELEDLRKREWRRLQSLQFSGVVKEKVAWWQARTACEKRGMRLPSLKELVFHLHPAALSLVNKEGATLYPEESTRFPTLNKGYHPADRENFYYLSGVPYRRPSGDLGKYSFWSWSYYNRDSDYPYIFRGTDGSIDYETKDPIGQRRSFWTGDDYDIYFEEAVICVKGPLEI